MTRDEAIFAFARDTWAAVSLRVPEDALISGVWRHSTGKGYERSDRIGWLTEPKGYVEAMTCRVEFK